MDARVKVAGTFSLDKMDTFVVHGFVETGAPREGMRPRNVAGLDVRVASVEFLRRPDGREAVALLFDCADASLRTRLVKSLPAGSVIDLEGDLL